MLQDEERVEESLIYSERARTLNDYIDLVWFYIDQFVFEDVIERRGESLLSRGVVGLVELPNCTKSWKFISVQYHSKGTSTFTTTKHSMINNIWVRTLPYIWPPSKARLHVQENSTLLAYKAHQQIVWITMMASQPNYSQQHDFQNQRDVGQKWHPIVANQTNTSHEQFVKKKSRAIEISS